MRRITIILVVLAMMLTVSATLTGCSPDFGSNFINPRPEATAQQRTPVAERDRDIDATADTEIPVSDESDDGQAQEASVERLTGNEIAALADSVLTVYVFDSNGNLVSQGSGFIAVDDRTLVTNYHVIKNAYTVTAVSESDIHYNIIGAMHLSPDLDLAVLRFETHTNLTPLPFADSSQVLVGDEVYAIGSPQGLKNTLSNGIVSAFRDVSVTNLIQFTAAVSQGSSGGALLNVYGEVIGIPTWTFLTGQNLNLAVPIDLIGENMSVSDKLAISYPDERQLPTQATPVVNQSIDFRDWNLTDSQREELQSSLNARGNPSADAIDVVGFDLSYKADGSLVLIAFIRNGLNQLVNIRTFEPLTINTTDGRVIASGNFAANYGTLLPSQSIIWEFTYLRDFVLITDADLSEYRVHARYYY